MVVFFGEGRLEDAQEYLNKAKILRADKLSNMVLFFLIQERLQRDYNISEIYELVNKQKRIEFRENYYLYILLKDDSYLESAYLEIKEKSIKNSEIKDNAYLKNKNGELSDLFSKLVSLN